MDGNEKEYESTVEGERIILGAMTGLPQDCDFILGRLRADHFIIEDHRVIFNAIKELRARSANVETSLIFFEIQKAIPSADIASWLAKIMEIGCYYGKVDGPEEYVNVIVSRWAKRRLLELLVKFTGLMRFSQDADAVWAQMLNEHQNVGIRSASDTIVFASNAMAIGFSEFEKRFADYMSGNQNQVGLSTGLKTIDEEIGGFKKGNLIVIGARPSVGKTALALNIAKNIALRQRLPVVFFSMEMTVDELVTRLFSVDSGVSTRDYEQGSCTYPEAERLRGVLNDAENSCLMIDPLTNILTSQFRAKVLYANSLAMQKFGKPLACVFVDYIQLLAGVRQTEKDSQTNEKVAGVTRLLKVLAAELQIPIVALSQLNRDSAKREVSKETSPEESMPALHNLRDSGAIEQDANVVLLLDRAIGGDSPESILRAKVAKNRGGKAGKILEFSFNLPTQLIRDMN